MSATRFSVSPTLRSWAEVDPDALRHNLSLVRRMVGPHPEILAVVKANGYGHGTEPVVKSLSGDVAVFGVANLLEARAVRSANTVRDVMLLSPCLPAEREEAVKEGLIVTVSSAAEAKDFAACGSVRANFKIDTGMGRVGAWWEEAGSELKKMPAGVVVHSISTHLPSSDEDERFTRGQLEGFFRLVETLKKLVPGAKIHSLNSAGIMKFPEHAADIVRAGLILYGSSPLPEIAAQCRPALTWKTRVTLIRELPAGAGVCYGRTFITPRPMRTAVLAVGYADGFPRQVSGRGASVLIGGKKCPVLGRVTMDQIVVDISEIDSVLPGDEAVLIGHQGAGTITAEELAVQAGTISWHIFTGINCRVARVYPG
ncbi:MAG: alanine racemase [Verrucomicrobiaceae bacterium]|nr:MAG: alanine racemase [Verrucomicrobiaceae bacterium]